MANIQQSEDSHDGAVEESVEAPRVSTLGDHSTPTDLERFHPPIPSWRSGGLLCMKLYRSQVNI